MPMPPAHAGADAGLPGVEQGGHAALGDRLVEHVGAAVVGIEALHGRVELEAADAEVLDQPPRLARAHLALGRVDAGERDQDVAVLRGELGHLLVVVAPEAGLALGVDRKDHRADLALAEIGGGLRDGRRMLERRLEIGMHAGLEVVIAVVGVGAARLLGMGVDVDGGKLAELEHADVLRSFLLVAAVRCARQSK